MRYIKKGSAPQIFVSEVSILPPDSLWQDLTCTVSLRAHLVNEQSGLCIYCEGGIEPSSSHIEHIVPQGSHPEGRFDYQNLAAS